MKTAIKGTCLCVLYHAICVTIYKLQVTLFKNVFVFHVQCYKMYFLRHLIFIFQHFRSEYQTKTWSSGLRIRDSHLYILNLVLFLEETVHISEFSVIITFPLIFAHLCLRGFHTQIKALWTEGVIHCTDCKAP